jgi:hypothetical protein
MWGTKQDQPRAGSQTGLAYRRQGKQQNAWRFSSGGHRQGGRWPLLVLKLKWTVLSATEFAVSQPGASLRLEAPVIRPLQQVVRQGAAAGRGLRGGAGGRSRNCSTSCRSDWSASVSATIPRVGRRRKALTFAVAMRAFHECALFSG